jgi:hypothetical protein
MPLGIPDAMREEHEELHNEPLKATRIPGPVGKTAKHVAEILHPHFERENELAMPVIGLGRELAEDGSSTDFPRALELTEKFKSEYAKMLREHEEIVEGLAELEKAAKSAKKHAVIEFARKLRMHAKTQEDLIYPAVLIVGKLLKQNK